MHRDRVIRKICMPKHEHKSILFALAESSQCSVGMRIERLAMLLCMAAAAVCLQAAPTTKIRVVGPATWVDPSQRSDVADEPSPEAVGGFDILLYDNQISVPEKARYMHYVYRVTSAEGVQHGAQVSVQFNPEFEELDFHHVRVERAGSASDRLDLEKVRSIQQEKDLERFQYNGQITALLLLDDLRIGDIVDVAYSVRGRNPIFDDNFSSIAVLGSSSPTRLRQVRVVADPSRPVYTSIHGVKDGGITQRSSGGQIEMLWTATKQRPINIDDSIPLGFSPFPFLQFSTYGSWSSVADWALPLYEIKDPIPPTVALKAAELTANATEQEDKALAILHFVQEEVRYLGIQVGSHSHKPNPPEMVLERRYGDCKDKVILLCAMLKSVGVRCVPALTHSTLRNRIPEYLPDPSAFDHVIARMEVGKERYFVDPTLTDQAGRLKFRALPEYGWALPVEAGSNALVHVETDSTAKSGIFVEEHYAAKEWGGEVSLEVRTVYYGLWADGIRSFCKRNTAEELGKYYLNRRARYYPKARLVAPIKWETGDRTNTVTVTSRYVLPEMWQPVAGTTRKSAEFIPAVLMEQTSAPEAVNRSMPFALGYPMNIAYVATIKTPVAIKREDSSDQIDSEYLRGSIALTSSGDDAKIEARLSNKVSEVPADKVTDYAARLREFRGHLGYTVSFDPVVLERNKVFRLNWILVGVISMASLVSAYVGWRVYHWPTHVPAVASLNPEYATLGGWLVLVGFGVTIRPLAHLVQTVKLVNAHLDARVWPMPAPGRLVSAFGFVVSGEVAFNVFILCLSVVMMIAFYNKRRVFPGLFVAYVTLAILSFFVDALAVYSLLDRPFNLPPELWQMVIPAMIWVPYMLNSKRVHATFVNGPQQTPLVSAAVLSSSSADQPPPIQPGERPSS